jgi:hypothetical protein
MSFCFQPHVQREAKRVTASMYGLGRRTAVFREGLGCTLIVDRSENELRAQAAIEANEPQSG